MLDMVTKKTLNANGGDRSSITCNTENPAHQGNSREYTVARLERDGFADLAEQVMQRRSSLPMPHSRG